MGIVRNELLRGLDCDGNNRVEEVDEFFGLIFLRKEEIDAVFGFLDVERIAVSAVLHDQLFEEEECSLVEDLLADLDASTPDVGGVRLGAFRTLLCGDNVDNLEALLQHDAILNLVLDSELDLYSSRVGFCPHEAGIDDADFVQTTQLLEA